MISLTRLVLRHRRWVLLLWLVSLLVGGWAAGRTADRLSLDFSLPGQPGYETEKVILEEYGNGGSNQPLLVVVTVPEGSTVDDERSEITQTFAQMQAAVPKARWVDFSQTDDPIFVTDDKRTTYALVYPAPFASFADPGPQAQLRPLAAQAAQQTGFEWELTGYQLLAQGSEDPEAPSLLVDTLLAGSGALLVLLFLFASLLAFVPLAIAAVSILTTFTIVLLGTYVMDISFVVQFLIALIGLGVAIDYSLLIVTRWREERAHGRENHEAIEVAMQTAGHAVVASAATVAISLCALLVIPVPLLRSMGVGGLLIPLVSTLVVLTLLPALLGGIGPRAEWPRIRNENVASRAWTAWGRLIVRFRWVALALAVAILAALIVPLFSIKIGQAQTDSLASGGPAYESLQTVKRGGVPAGIVSPFEVLVTSEESVDEVVEKAKNVEGVAAAFAPVTAQWRKDGSALIAVIPVEETVDSDKAQLAEDLTEALTDVPAVEGVAGIGATVLDYINAVYKNFPYTLGLIALVTFLLLVRTFRSIVLSVKAIVLNVLSVAATFGATVLFWQQGYGSEAIFDIQATGAIAFWVPILIFAFLFGLSMDYEVFILARMREEYDRSGSTETAVIEGIGRTGRLITGAAVILFFSFLALTASPGTDVKVLATALGIGILLDATVVRALLVPALVSLMGKYNWWLPSWAAKPLRVEEHAAIPEPRGHEERAKAQVGGS